MKLRKLSEREKITLIIWFNGANSISCSVTGLYIWAGCNIALGLILIYLREKYY